MARRKGNCLFFWILIALGACGVVTVLAAAFLLGGRALPTPVRQELYDGVTYYRRFHTAPRFFIVHVVAIDLNNPNIHFLVTPPDEASAELPLSARTTSQFLEEFGAQIAINGDGFTPWHSNGRDDYYPHVGDPIRPNGFAMSNGIEYGNGPAPTLYISSGNAAAFNDPSIGAANALSGDRMLALGRQPLADLPDDIPAPRTAIGLDLGGNRLILMVVDGRQPLYSLGVTLRELAELMLFYGADSAMNLDGGGSTTLVIQDASGAARVLNSPIDNQIAGRERPVGNHLGVFVSQP